MAFDLLIRGGKILDGAGNPWFEANVYLKDGKIASITTTRQGEADKVIDAEGLFVAPGFIDIHDHAESTLFTNPRAESLIHQGVTTVGTCNCGFSPAPVRREYKKKFMRWYEPFTMGLGMPNNWESFEEYFERLERNRLGVNLWPQVGHGTVRIAVMGFEARTASRSEMEEMKSLVDQAFGDGVAAMSTGLGYAPGCYSKLEEVVELAKVVAKHGGLYTTDMGQTSLQDAVEIGEETGVPIQISHYGGSGIEEARGRGLDITFDAYPYTAGSSMITELMPPWAWEGGLDAMLERMSSADFRERLKSSFEASRHRGVWRTAVVSFVLREGSKKYEGSFIEEIAGAEKTHPVDFLCDLLLENNGIVMYVNRDSRRESYVFETLRNPYHFVMSDGWAFAPYGPLHVGKPHPRAYGAFPRVLGWYVRECNAIPLQEAIRKMTSAPAQKMGIRDRGLVREGFWADLTLFNPRTVIDRASFQEPHQYPEGIEYVIVNGQLVIDKGEHTGALPGKILRREHSTS